MLNVGQIVLYTDSYTGKTIPAIVTKAFADGSANLRVFPDDDSGGLHFAPHVKPDEKGAKGTYRPLPANVPDPPVSLPAPEEAK